jgi:hypothetical protein
MQANLRLAEAKAALAERGIFSPQAKPRMDAAVLGQP